MPVSRSRLVVAISLAFFVYGMASTSLGTLLPEFSSRFAFTPGQNGNLASLRALMLTAVSLVAGPLVDRWGKKPALLLALLSMALALAVLPLLHGFAPIAAAIVLLNCGNGLLVTAGNALVTDIPTGNRAGILNFLNLFFCIGAFATPFVGGFLFAGNTLRLCYLVAALTAVTLLDHALTGMPPPEPHHDGAPRPPAILRHPLVLLFSLILFLYVAVEVGVWDWLATDLISRGFPREQAFGILSFGFALGLTFGRLGAVRVLRHYRPIDVTLAAACAMVGTTWALLHTTSVWTTGAAAFLAGIAMAPVYPTTLALISELFPVRPATAMSIAITAGWLGLTASSRLIGMLAGTDPYGLTRALSVLPALSLAIIAVNLLARRKIWVMG